MAINRRELIKALSAGTVTAISSTVWSMPVNSNANELIIGACRLNQTQFAVSACDLSGRLKWQLPLPGRAHDCAIHAHDRVGVVIARRPGRFITLFNIETGKLLQQFNVNEDTKLNGHACWLGNRLIVSASDKNSSQMRLLCFKLVRNQLTLAQTKSYNFLGPHQLVLNKGSLWVAIGGLQTNGRDTINKDSFESALIKLSADDLTVKNVYPSPVHNVSLRHLSVSDAGEVYIAGQNQQADKNSECLLFALRNEKLTPIQIEDALWNQIKGYIGSIVTINDSIVVTSPRAHWMGWFNKQTLRFEKQYLTQDICALASTHSGLIAGTGTGRLYINGELMNSHVIWDNHFASVILNQNE